MREWLIWGWLIWCVLIVLVLGTYHYCDEHDLSARAVVGYTLDSMRADIALRMESFTAKCKEWEREQQRVVKEQQEIERKKQETAYAKLLAEKLQANLRAEAAIRAEAAKGIYRYYDEDGTLHITTDIKAIPGAMYLDEVGTSPGEAERNFVRHLISSGYTREQATKFLNDLKGKK